MKARIAPTIAAAILASLVTTPPSLGQVICLEVIDVLSCPNGMDGDAEGNFVDVWGDTVVYGAEFADDAGPDAGEIAVFRHDGIEWTADALFPPDLEPADRLNYARISGDTIVMGSQLHDGGEGAAWVARFDGTGYEFEAELTGADIVPGDRFASTADISGDVIAVGAWMDDAEAGAVHVFRFDGVSWGGAVKIAPPPGETHFGRYVAIEGNVIVVGASHVAYVYRFDGAQWLEDAVLTSPVGDASFGFSVGISRGTIIVGAPNETDTGAAHVYRLQGGAWVLEGTLEPSVASSGAFFGSNVSIDGGRAVVGAYADNVVGAMSGSAFLFDRQGKIWTQRSRLLPSDGLPGDRFGISTAIDGGVVVIGANQEDAPAGGAGRAYVFDIDHPCRADFNGDCMLNILDVVACQNAIVAGCP